MIKIGKFLQPQRLIRYGFIFFLICSVLVLGRGDFLSKDQTRAFRFSQFLGIQQAYGDDSVSVSATVDRNEMSQGDTLTLTVSVNSSSSVGLENPKLPDLKGFDLLNTWTGSETRSTFSNGKFNVEKTQNFNYMLQPNHLGKLTIGSTEIIANGKSYKTRPIVIHVVKGNPQNSQRGKRRKTRRPPGFPSDPFDDMQNDVDSLFSQFLQNRPRPGYRSQIKNPNEAFFVQVNVDKTEAYEGEQITASWYIYTRGQITDIDTLKYPSLKGFWKEDIEIPTRLNWSQEVINGIAYRKALLASYALFPIKSGTAIVDPYKAKCTVLMSSGFGFGRPYSFTKSSKEVKIKIMPVPKENRPSDYSGAIGSFKVTSSLESKEAQVDQPITYKIHFEGRGNAKLIDIPPLNLPSNVEVYDTKKTSKFFKNGTSFKDFEILLIPRSVGKVEIPSLSVSMFNPDTGQFYSQKTNPIQFDVMPGSGGIQADMGGTPSGKEVSPMASGVVDQGPQLILTPPERSPWIEKTGTLIWGFLYILGILFLIWRAVVELGEGSRKKSLVQHVQDKFKIIHDKTQRGDWRGVGKDVVNLFYFLLGEIVGEEEGGVEFEKLLLKAPPSVRNEMGDEMIKLLKYFEVLAFAPEEVVGKYKDPKELIRIVAEIEKVLNKSIELGLGRSVESN